MDHTDLHIPGFAEISDWPSAPSPPFRINSHGAYGDPRPYCTYYVDLIDAAGVTHPFFFDRFLGRLCYGQNEDDEHAAFLRRGSRVQLEVFSILRDASRDAAELVEVRRRLDHAGHWV